MMRSNNPTCNKCVYWIQRNGSEYQGECRRHAPQAVQGGRYISLLAAIKSVGMEQEEFECADAEESIRSAEWPLTERDDWCGDYNSALPETSK